jgi:dynein heavy chain
MPLIFVLSAGADPESAVYKFAEEFKISKRIVSVLLGQGKGPRAEVLMKDSKE